MFGPIDGPKSIIFGAHAQIWAYSVYTNKQTKNYPILMKLCICVQETSSYKYEYFNVILQNWATNLPNMGVAVPLKSSVTGPSLLVNFYLEIMFHKIIRVNPPPPPTPLKRLIILTQ